MQKITIIGAGYVGLVTGACFAEIGHQVMCVDSDPVRIELLRRGRSPIYEAGLEELINENRDHLRFTTDLGEGLDAGDAVFLAVGTPTAPDGRADLAHVRQAAAEIGRRLRREDLAIVVKSTVPVGTTRLVERIIQENLPEPKRFFMAFCPEFLREGTAVKDVLEADRVVIGADDLEIFDRVARIYRRFGRKIVHTDIVSAEMVKYASNAFLAAKISFSNEIANLCELTGANIDHVVKGMGLDSRIGDKFLRAGIGYGGSCFPKDTNALLKTAEDAGYDFSILRSVVEVNRRQAERFLEKIFRRYPGGLAGRTAAVWGLAFKPGTDDVRESPALRIVSALAERGCRPRLYDPAAMNNFRKSLPDLPCEYSVSAAAAAEGADLLVILTEWEEFAGFPLERLGGLLKEKIVFDGRNCLSRRSAEAHGFEYFSVGRPDLPAR